MKGVLKIILFGLRYPDTEGRSKVDAEGRSKPCGGKERTCEVHKSVNDTSHFKRRDTKETFKILKAL